MLPVQNIGHGKSEAAAAAAASASCEATAPAAAVAQRTQLSSVLENMRSKHKDILKEKERQKKRQQV